MEVVGVERPLLFFNENWGQDYSIWSYLKSMSTEGIHCHRSSGMMSSGN